MPRVRVQRLFEKVVFLYVVAAQLAGDLAGVNIRYDGLNIEIFQRYRTELEQVLLALEAAHAKIAELGNDSAAIQKVERDLIKNLEFLYVIFSCAITTKGKDRAAAQLAALGFRSDMVKPPGVPWNPLLKASFGIAAVL